MGRLRSLIALLGSTVFIAAGAGCKGTGWKAPQGVPTAPLSSQVKPEANPVVQAGGSSPFAAMPSSLSWMGGKSSEKAAKATKTNAANMVVAFQNHIDYLPDPVREGAPGPGLAAQIFLFDARDQPAIANGTLTIDLYDDTPRPAGQSGIAPERWQFRKDVLKELRSVDERFGPNYVIFLPWPSYRPDVSRVRIRARFDPDQGGFTNYAPETKLGLDPTLSGKNETGASVVGPQIHSTSTVTPGASGANSTPPNSGDTPNNGPGMGVFRMERHGGQSTTSSTTAPPGEFPAGSASPIRP